MKRELIIALIFLIAMSILTIVDVLADLSEGASIGHVTLELIALTIGVLGSLLIARQITLRFHIAISTTQQDLVKIKAQADRWKAEAHSLLRGLSVQIDSQFESWSFTKAERATSLLP